VTKVHETLLDSDTKCAISNYYRNRHTYRVSYRFVRRDRKSCLVRFIGS